MSALLAGELRDLLALNPPDFRRSFIASDDSLVLFGAGTLGRSTLAKLRDVGVNPLAFADDTLTKQDTEIDGLPVMSPERIASLYGPKVILAVTILQPKCGFLEVRKRLKKIPNTRVASFLELARSFPRTLLPHYHYSLPDELLKHPTEIQTALSLWHDEESRHQFMSHIRFRLHADYAALPAKSQPAYFPEEVSHLLSSETTFVDCGAFDGDTVRAFLLHQKNIFRKIVALEPDPLNYRKLRNYVASLCNNISKKIDLHNTAVGNFRRSGRIDSTAGPGSCVTESGDVAIEIAPLRDFVSPGDHPMYIKLDIEGMEAEALQGLAGLVSGSSPIMAVSVYHRPNDLWELPIYLKQFLGTECKLFLRTEGEDGMEAICYAIPAR
jgi:FkbM family methyltransferase